MYSIWLSATEKQVERLGNRQYRLDPIPAETDLGEALILER
jgi:hypothetical protein